MDIPEIILAGLIICIAGMIQSAVGFGYALFATPLLVWLGLPLPSVIVIVSACAVLQSAIGAKKLNADVPWKIAFIATGIRIINVLIGLFVLKQMVNLDAKFIRGILGTILCVLVAVQFIWKPKPLKKIHWSCSAGAFSASGFLAGLCGMGGPPLVLWSISHDWSTQKTRGFLFAVFMTSIPLQFILMCITFGPEVLKDFAFGLAFSPAVLLGTAIGLPIGNRITKKKLKLIALSILLIIGVSAIIPAILRIV